MSEYVCIPARCASTRLPGKPLVLIQGEPMIRRVCRQALQAEPEKVIVCTDDLRVAEAVSTLNGVEVCMTSAEAKSGTDRIAMAAAVLKLAPDDVIVNVQGDEPLIKPEHIKLTAQLLQDKRADMATLCAPITRGQDLFDPSCVKVVLNKQGFAMYFSRAPIPYERDNFMHHQPPAMAHYHHIGIYAYTAATVQKFAALEQTPAERAESLEQLRILENGMTIAAGIITDPPETGVDTPEDLERVNAVLALRRRQS